MYALLTMATFNLSSYQVCLRLSYKSRS